jgi:hypothetical protein
MSCLAAGLRRVEAMMTKRADVEFEALVTTTGLGWPRSTIGSAKKPAARPIHDRSDGPHHAAHYGMTCIA